MAETTRCRSRSKLDAYSRDTSERIRIAFKSVLQLRTPSVTTIFPLRKSTFLQLEHKSQPILPYTWFTTPHQGYGSLAFASWFIIDLLNTPKTMAPITPTAFPPEFNNVGGDSDPAEFLKFLQAMITKYLSEDSPRIAESSKDAWVAIVDGLADNFLQSFPLPDMTLWNLMQEKVAMTETTLQIIQRVFSCVDGIYNNAEVLVKKMFKRLIDLCSVLDIWLETSTIYDDSPVSPTSMQTQASNIVVCFLRGMGNNSPLLSSDCEPSWKILRNILQECVDICQGIVIRGVDPSRPKSNSIIIDLINPTAPFPKMVYISFFQKPSIINDDGQPLQETVRVSCFCVTDDHS